MIEGIWLAIGAFIVFWICATIHEIHIDLKRIGDILRDKQLEIPNPLQVSVEGRVMTERYESQ